MSAIKETLKNFDEQFPIGTPVSFLMPSGKVVHTKTWSHAGIVGTGKKQAAGVFVEAVEAPVLLSNLKIEGYDLVHGRKK